MGQAYHLLAVKYFVPCLALEIKGKIYTLIFTWPLNPKMSFGMGEPI